MPEAFDMERSLSPKGCPYDNAVAEATFKIIKTEFIWNERFYTLKELKVKLWDYVNWYNHHCIHSSLNYQTPVQYRENNLKKLSKKVLTTKLTPKKHEYYVEKILDNSKHLSVLSSNILSISKLENQKPIIDNIEF